MVKSIPILFASLAFCTAIWAQEPTVLKLSLPEIFCLADEQSHTLRRADFDVERAISDLASSKMQWTPELSLSVSAGYLGNELLTNRNFSNSEGIGMPHFSNKLSLQLTQTLYDSGICRDIEIKRTAKELTSVECEVSRQEIRFLLTQWYLYYLKLVNLKQVYLDDKARLTRLLEETTERYKQGAALKSDVTNYSLKVKDAQLLLSKNANQLKIINYRLVKLLGLPEGTHLMPDNTFLESEMQALQTETNRISVTESPLLRQSENTYELSLQNERLIRAKRWPRLFFWGENIFNGPVTTALPPVNKNVNLWGVGIGLSFNIGNLYRSGHMLRSSGYSAKMAQENVALVQDKLDTEFYTARIELEETFAELTNRNEYRELASKLYEVMYERYSNGMAITTEMLDAGNELLAADIECLNMRIELFLHYYTLKRITGTL